MHIVEKPSSKARSIDMCDQPYNEYFCTRCGAVLNEQPGFDSKKGSWVCTKCGIQLYGDEAEAKPDPKPEFKRTAKKAVKWAAVIGGVILTAAVAVASVISGKKGEEGHDDENMNDEDNVIAPPKKPKSYNGYLPRGCQACGGPYPLCRDGCPAFDD